MYTNKILTACILEDFHITVSLRAVIERLTIDCLSDICFSRRWSFPWTFFSWFSNAWTTLFKADSLLDEDGASMGITSQSHSWVTTILSWQRSSLKWTTNWGYPCKYSSLTSIFLASGHDLTTLEWIDGKLSIGCYRLNNPGLTYRWLLEVNNNTTSSERNSNKKLLSNSR